MMNIGGSEDPFFRYKMPDIQVKVEGRGNGIKTVIPNMADIGLSLKRDPGYTTKFFATELGALSQWDDKRNVGIVNGEHSKGRLAELLADFIQRYVLCPECNNPETTLKVKKGMIYYKCLACGDQGLSDNQHKLATYIVNHPPGGEKDKKGKGKKDKGKKKDKNKGNKKRQQSRDEEEEEPVKEQEEAVEAGDQPEPENGEETKEKEVEEDGEIHFEITEEMRQMKVDESNAHIDDPVELLQDALDEADDVAGKAEAVKRFGKEQDFQPDECFKYAVKALVKSSMSAELKANAPLLKKIMLDGREGQLLLLACVEERCEAFPENLNEKSVLGSLQTLYNEDLLEEDIIVEWYHKGLSQLIALADVSVADAARKASKRFVEWLETAEEESDEE